jgi:glycerol-3-phosphate dehydrogenase
VRDTLTGEVFAVEAKTVVNATGNFVDVIRRMDSADSVPLLQAQAGTHVILNKNYSAVQGANVGLYLPRTPDGSESVVLVL